MKTSKKVICLLMTLIMVVSSLPMVAFEAEAANSSVLKVKYWDIEGDSTAFFYTGKKKFCAIVDTGSAKPEKYTDKNKYFIDKIQNKANLDMLEYDKSMKKRIINLLCLTHIHGDHIGGFYDLLNSGNFYIANLVVNNVYINDSGKRKINGKDMTLTGAINYGVLKGLIGSVIYANTYNDIIKYGMNIDYNDKYCIFKNFRFLDRQGAILHRQILNDSGNTLKLTVFPALKKYGSNKVTITETDQNNSSMMIKLEYSKNGAITDYVFLGDICREAMRDIVGSGIDIKNAAKKINPNEDYCKWLRTNSKTFLKINHHASRRVRNAQFYSCNFDVKEYMANKNWKSTNFTNPNYDYTYNGQYHKYTYKQSVAAFNEIITWSKGNGEYKSPDGKEENTF